MDSISKALQIAITAHAGQVDKAGKPYINHPIRVARGLKTNDLKIVALLHDVLEDSPMTVYDLQQHFTKPIVDAVVALTRYPGTDYTAYLMAIKGNELARLVKLADLDDNMDLTRLPTITEADIKRTQRYMTAYNLLNHL